MRGKEAQIALNHEGPNSIKVSKLDAAFRQLRAAILLYFSDGDPVAIHTLACASHEILRKLCDNAGVEVGLTGKRVGSMKIGISETQGNAYLSVAAGFFKHAGKDANQSIFFQPEVNDHFLNEAVCLYVDLTGERHEFLECLRFAVILRNINLLNKAALPAEDLARWEKAINETKKIGISPRYMMPVVSKMAQQYLASLEERKKADTDPEENIIENNQPLGTQ